MLSERAGTVLNILVDEYITTANPVASDDIARLSPVRVSPATVRNTMSQLSGDGYIARPHVSAGAVPLNRGYRHFVESLKEPHELPFGLQQQICQQFRQVEPDVEVWSRRCANILSRVAANMAIVTVPWQRSPRLKHIELVYLEEFLALLIIVLEEARLLRRLVSLEQTATQGQLTQVANKLNDQLASMNRLELEEAVGELDPLEHRVKGEVITTLRDAEVAKLPQHYIDGLRWILNQPEFTGGESAKDLVGMIEEEVLLQTLLARAPEAGSVAVYIGDENEEEALRPFGVILCQYGVAERATGTICVIGPTRMSYAQTMGGVSFLSSLMDQMVRDTYGSGPQMEAPVPKL